MQRQT